jgi:UDPglucose--hexose-1-phosphate uridylyltransferase
MSQPDTLASTATPLPPELRPHRRYNPLIDEWILVSPQRAARPWLGQQEKPATAQKAAYDPKCYLCPGNERAVGKRNPPYTGVYVFDNDFPALLPAAPEPGPRSPHPLLQRQDENGVCRVICFSPRHDLSLPELPHADVRGVVDTWAAQCAELGARDDVGYVQLFENKGEAMGASNPHPHGQLWATRHVPVIPAKEQETQAAYLREHGQPLLLDYLDVELRDRSRLLFENDHFAAVVPYWAVWPFETMILSKAHVRRVVDLTGSQRDGLANALQTLTRKYDRLFDVSFPYSMGVHQAPYDNADHDEWQMHIHFYPPLLRSATVRKFLVGYEMLAQPQRDLTAEQAADRLRPL